ncbi:WD40 repeat domain-containing protein [Nonomuraea sp. SYSU D8015]|uniref:WD40 repeat domain-containing protein n=1 Tax=Nonomuraea sp. SYSU D8015 TaxID=2593644 RepID=UPI001660F672|nr:hypothetical protein [Nonomuraea sp. SYSU D8015]
MLSAQNHLLGGRLPARPGSAMRLDQAATPDGTFVATYDNAHRVQLWHMPTRRLVHDLDTGPGAITGIAVGADGQSVAVAVAKERQIWLWSQRRQHVETIVHPVTALAFSSGAETLAVAGPPRAGSHHRLSQASAPSSPQPMAKALDWQACCYRSSCSVTLWWVGR